MVFWLSSFRDLRVKTGLCFRLHTHSFVNREPPRLWIKMTGVPPGATYWWQAELTCFGVRWFYDICKFPGWASKERSVCDLKVIQRHFPFFIFLYHEGVAGHPGPHAVQEDQSSADNYQILPSLQSQVLHPRGGQTLPRHQDHEGLWQARAVANPA